VRDRSLPACEEDHCSLSVEPDAWWVRGLATGDRRLAIASDESADGTQRDPPAGAAEVAGPRCGRGWLAADRESGPATIPTAWLHEVGHI
jgi:hypothetical protein